MKERFFNVNRTVFTVITMPFILYSLFCLVFSLSCRLLFIDYIVHFFSAVSLILWFIVLFYYYCKNEKVKNFFAVIIIVVAVIFVFIFMPFYSLLILTSGKTIMVSSSPNGENELIVRQGGFIDATYNANPVKYKWFFKHQNNGFVSNHDDWGGSEIEIEWISNNKAIVRIQSNFTPNPNSNTNNEIIVTFD